MNASMAGALIGFILGFAGFLVLRMAASRLEARADEIKNARQSAQILRYAALADWLLMIVVGFFLGPIAMGGAN